MDDAGPTRLAREPGVMRPNCPSPTRVGYAISRCLLLTPFAKSTHRVSDHRAGRVVYVRVVAAAAMVLYLGLSVFALDHFPIVGQDEPWIAAPAYKLATDGTLGSDLFAGYHGMERHHFVHMPVYAVTEAAIFRMFGTGVVQMRALSVLFGLALLVIAYLVGQEVGGERVASSHGRAAGLSAADRRHRHQTDRHSADGLRAHESLRHRGPGVRAGGVMGGDSRRRPRSLRVDGHGWRPRRAVIAQPSLRPVLAAVRRRVSLLQKGIGRSALAAVAGVWLGFVAVWLPWLAWIALNWPDYVAQMRTVAGRFELFTPAFYAQNILRANGPISLDWTGRTLRTLPPDRLGAWALVVGAPISLYMLGRRGPWRLAGQAALLLSCIIQFALFVALL